MGTVRAQGVGQAGQGAVEVGRVQIEAVRGVQEQEGRGCLGGGVLGLLLLEEVRGALVDGGEPGLVVFDGHQASL